MDFLVPYGPILLQHVYQFFPFFGINPHAQLARSSFYNLFPAVAAEPHESVVYLYVPPLIESGDSKPVRAGTEGLRKLLLRQAQSLLQLFAPGDVTVKSEDIFIPIELQHASTDFNSENSAIFPDVGHFFADTFSPEYFSDAVIHFPGSLLGVKVTDAHTNQFLY